MESKKVTLENMAEVAQWCGGSVEEDSEILGLNKPFIHVDDDWLAFSGTWVVREKQPDGTYKYDVMEEDEYKTTYRVYLQVLQIITDALTEQDALTYHGRIKPSKKDRANDITQKILEIM